MQRATARRSRKPIESIGRSKGSAARYNVARSRSRTCGPFDGLRSLSQETRVCTRLSELRGELIHGRAVTLVGQTGKPKLVSLSDRGPHGSSSTLADDKTFTIHSWTLNLLELLPDPKCDRYRFTAQIRHETASDVVAGEVGLYFARVGVGDTNNRAVHSFLQLSFNAVIGDAEFRQRLPADFARRRPVRKNPWLCCHTLYSERVCPPKRKFQARRRIRATVSTARREQQRGRWHQVEVILTPERVTASFNGESVSVSTESLRRNALAELAMFPLNDTSPSPGNPTSV